MFLSVWRSVFNRLLHLKKGGDYVSDLYLKVTNDIQEDFLICYVYTDGLCYGLKYSPDEAKLCVVELNSKRTRITSEQSNGAETLDLPIKKDNVIHIYKDESVTGKFYVSYINETGEKCREFFLENIENKKPVLEEEAFEFADVAIDVANSDVISLGSEINFLTSINSGEYSSKLAQESTSQTTEQTTSEISTDTPETTEQLSSEENAENAHESGTADVSITTVATTTNKNNSSFNGVPFIIGGAALVVVIAAVFVIKKLTGEKQKTTITKTWKDHFIDCQFINQSNIRSSKKLLAHSLFKTEDSGRNSDFDIKLAELEGYKYYKAQSTGIIKYQKPTSRLDSTYYISYPFIIAMSDSWNLVIAKHNDAKSITLDIFNKNYILKMQMDFEQLCLFLGYYIEKYEYDRDFPAYSFLRVLNILCSHYSNSDYAADSRINIFRENLSNKRSEWDKTFKTKLPPEVFNAVIIIAELYIMKNTAAKNSDKDSKWEELIGLLQGINKYVDAELSKPNFPEPGPPGPIVYPLPPKPDPPEPDYPKPKLTLAEQLYEHYENLDDFLENKLPAYSYCRPSDDVLTYLNTSPYTIINFLDKRKKTTPEFLLLGNNKIVPNPYRFRNGIIRTEDIKKGMLLKDVFDFDSTPASTGKIKEIIPAEIDKSTMAVIQKGRIVFEN